MSKFLKFSNSDGKEWIVPKKNMRTALSIYQPSGIKGRLLHLFLPYLYWLPMVRRAIHAKSMAFSLGKELTECIKRVLSIDNFEFSIYEGTPSVHKKRIIQIFKGTKILAYCKISAAGSVVKLLKNGQKTLSYLHKVGIDSVPTCYYCDKVAHNSDVVCFIQSTTKTERSKTLHEFGDKHWAFLDDLYQKTRLTIPFEDSDFARSINSLEAYLSIFSPEDAHTIIQGIKRVRDYYKGDVEFSAYHGDFTPWNMYLEGDELFVFDFEYAGLSYPPFMDRFHFFTQTIIFEKHLTGRAIDELYVIKRAEIIEYCANVEIVYTAYILDIISRYISRENADLSIDSQNMIDIWLKILNRL